MQRRRLSFELGDLAFDGGKQLEIAGHEARGARARSVAPDLRRRSLDQGRAESQTEIVVAGEIYVVAPGDTDHPRIYRLHVDQAPLQALAAKALEEPLVPAFASDHDPVLAR